VCLCCAHRHLTDQLCKPNQLHNTNREDEAAAAAAGHYGLEEGHYPGWHAVEGDEVVDPAEIPLCPEYERSGICSGGEDCPLIHGDLCEVRAGGGWVRVGWVDGGRVFSWLAG